MGRPCLSCSEQVSQRRSVVGLSFSNILVFINTKGGKPFRADLPPSLHHIFPITKHATCFTFVPFVTSVPFVTQSRPIVEEH